jgi:peptidoglycan/LPS O-acetylase OafA/YrhL
VQIAVQLPVTIALAALSYRYWESPFLALKERWFPHRRPAAAPAEPARTAMSG